MEDSIAELARFDETREPKLEENLLEVAHAEMEILFDTSAVNFLHDDPAGGAIINGLLATNVVRVSALSVVEAALTAEGERRRSLLRWLKHMTGNHRPLEMPNVLARRAVKEYGRKSQSLDWSIDTDASVVWQVLVDPESVDEALRADLYRLHRSFERDFRLCHERARPHFQSLFPAAAKVPRRASTFLREHLKRPDSMNRLVNDCFYREVVGTNLPVDETWELFRSVPEIAGFLLGWGHSIHRRAIAREGYGAHNNAGIMDLWFATYLGRVDRFVTADKRQYEALRLIARLIPDGRPASFRRGHVLGRCSITRYDAYRRLLILPQSA